MAEAKVKEKADEAGPAKAESGEPKKTGFLKLVIVMGVIQIVLAGGAFALMSLFVVPRASSTAENLSHGQAKALEEKKGPLEIHLIENIIINPAGTNGTRYLSTSIGFEIEKSEKAIEHMRGMTPVVRDILIAVLSSKPLDELSSSEGKETIRKEILEKVNQALSPESISKVYFVDYVLQ